MARSEIRWPRLSIFKLAEKPAPPQVRPLKRGPIRFELEDFRPRPVDPPKIEKSRTYGVRLKRRRKVAVCEACGWTPSAQMAKAFAQPWRIVQSHHVLPMAAGGEDADTNIVYLCPTCHAIAHRLGRLILITGMDAEWTGPTSPADLIARIKAIL